MDRIRGISIVVGGEVLAKDREIGRGDRVGKSDLLRDGVCSRSQIILCSVEKKRQEIHLGVVTLEGKMADDER